MILIIIGLALWVLAHLFQRLAPDLRASMGKAGRGVVALVLLLALVLLVIGYHSTPVAANLFVIPGNGHINNLLMLIAVIVFGARMSKGVLWTKIRHPMLWAVVIWAVAHILVHNDVASLVLFGGMGIWALVEMAVINASTGWTAPAPGKVKRDLVLVVIAIVMYGAITGIHQALGLNPFAGTYY
ncbi:hypothetical protein FGG78_19965 [Thioclava sp. BHET1]|nr:hypothetical protein FGG78_19965 [Thioclava sp. BHET1]